MLFFKYLQSISKKEPIDKQKSRIILDDKQTHLERLPEYPIVWYGIDW